MNIQPDDNNEDFTAKARKNNVVRNFMSYLRFLGLFHIFFGAYAWLYIIGGIYEDMPFTNLNFFSQVEVIFIATISVIAGLGLWLLTPWGVTLWLLHTTIVVFSNIFNENPIILLSLFIPIQAFFLIIYIFLRQKYEAFIEDFGHIHSH